ncbi:MAG: polygalacturonase [Sphingobacteriaceae bacterium]|nr:MAG: polygalacturonase [Sphingobacteriaceae bacterium]
MKFIRLLFVVGLLLLGYIQVGNAQDYNILNFGAVNDTSKLSTISINKAVDACNKHGGGRVIIPAGSYKSGTITLKNNVELYLSRGAILYASTQQVDFPRQRQPDYRSQKDPGGWYALIYAENAFNIGICGNGTIDGQGALQKIRPELPGGDLDGRPRNILLISCKKVNIENITMLNAGIWNQHYLNCEDVKVTGITVFNHCNRNNDGIDIDGCRRFVLSNSIIDSDDDGVVLKSTGLAGCEDVIINNCVVSSFTNALKCGTESTGGFKNIVFSNCTVKPSISKVASVFKAPPHGITGISLEIVDGGIMDGVVVNNIVIDGTECPIYVRLANRARKHQVEAPMPLYGQMKNIQLSNITAYHTGNYSSSITGISGSRIENMVLHNIRLVNKGGLKPGEYLSDNSKVKEDEKGYPEPTTWKNLPSYGLFIRHVDQISITSTSLGSEQPDPRIPLMAFDVGKLYINNFTVDNATAPIKIGIKQVAKFVDLSDHIIPIETN